MSGRPRTTPSRGVTIIEILVALCGLAGAITGAIEGARHGILGGVLGFVIGLIFAPLTVLVAMIAVLGPLMYWAHRTGRLDAPSVPPGQPVADGGSSESFWGGLKAEVIEQCATMGLVVVCIALVVGTSWLAMSLVASLLWRIAGSPLK